MIKRYHLYGLLAFVVFLFALLAKENFTQTTAQHFSIMAESFLKGRLDLVRLDPETRSLDIFFYKGQAHWANFPFPGLLLTPFVFLFDKLGIFFYQGYLQFFLTIGVFLTAFLIASKFKFSKIDSIYMALAATFASNYSFVAFYTGSWYFSQPVTVLLLFLAILEWYTKRRIYLVGILLGLLLATRATAIFAGLFFILEILRKKDVWSNKFKKISVLTLPILISAFVLLAYNHARFGSIWETGYTDENISPEFQVTMLKNHGIFKLENIPTNIYWNFLAPPEPVFAKGTYHIVSPYIKVNPIGLSFFIMSPLFLLIFKTLKTVKGEILSLWAGSLTSLMPLLMWYSTGFWQVGARYILDFYALWFVLILIALPQRKVSSFYKLIIIFSSLLNLILVLPIYGI